MKKKIAITLFLTYICFLWITIFIPTKVAAQQTKVRVVTSCGARTAPYTAGSVNDTVMDINGNLCTSGGLSAVTVATTSATVSIAAATTTQLIPLSGTTSIYVTGYGLTVAATTATADTVQFVYGTGSNCVSGQVALTGAMTGGTYTNGANGLNTPVILNYGSGVGLAFKTVAGQALCMKTTGTQNVSGLISFTQY